MAVKALLKEAMNAHLESQREWISTQTLPSVGVSYSPPQINTAQWTEYVAPANGTFSLVSAVGDPARGVVEMINERINFVSKTACWSGYGTVSVKVKKGDRVTAHVGGSGTIASTDQLYVSFFPDEGAA